MSNTLNLLTQLGDLAAASVATDVPIPDGGYEIPAPIAGKLSTVVAVVRGVGIVLAVVALVMIGIQFMMSRRAQRDGGENVTSLGWWIFGVVLIAAAFNLVGWLM